MLTERRDPEPLAAGHRPLRHSNAALTTERDQLRGSHHYSSS
ncbi:hypothetical protein [Nocardia miyunensis]|nr:hypothetical protein [Nocardia miyunensis]